MIFSLDLLINKKQIKMKKIILVALVAVLGMTTANAQDVSKKTKTVAPKVNGAGMLFENETIDYGT
ncbi:MAG: hypothetical protein QG594_1710, partial [Bacteroidota bacterium]|nr:hypothetical protein [Bacteroidota bacterium]